MKGLTEDAISGITSGIGGIKSIKPLHTRWIRGRESFRPEDKRQPKVFLLTSKSGGRYKLLTAAEYGRRIKRIKHFSERCTHFTFFPDLVSCGDGWLLYEYIEGRVPDFSSSQFSLDLGSALAEMHRSNRRLCDETEIRSHFEKDIKQLQASGYLRRSQDLRAVYDAFDALDLASCHTSLDYFDVKPGNFVRSTEGKLFFIDLGGVGDNRPTGQYLFGSQHHRKLDLDAFKKGYLNAGGSQAVLSREIPLRILNGIWLAAHYYRRAAEIPLYVAPMKYGYQVMARNCVVESSSLALQHYK